jgi:glycosyltransferase involved in cell wall biosynthesis
MAMPVIHRRGPRKPDAIALRKPQGAPRNGSVQPAPLQPASAPMTILQVVSDLHAGGAGRHAVEVADALVRSGHRAVIVSEGGRLEDAAARAGATVVKLPVASKNPPLMYANARKLAALARDFDADVLHAQSRAPAWSCLIANRMTQVPLVTTYDGSFSERNPLKRIYNSVMVRGTRVIAPGEKLASLVETRYGTARERIAIVPRAIDLTGFDPSRIDAPRRAALAAQWGIGERDRIILLPGRLTRPKAPHVLVEAAQRLREAGLSDFRCVFAGEHPGRSGYAGELWDRVHQQGLSGFIRFAGYCEDMPAAYSLADIVVCTSVSRGGHRRAVLEAQAMGVAVAVSDSENGDEIVRAPPFVAEARATGLLYRAGNGAELAQTLFKLLAMGAPARRAMGVRGREWIASQFSPETFAERLVAVYRDVVRRARERGT